ncbi:MAG: alpha-mannosidase [Phycisphaerales bacterium]|nr:MAG: alpha-mannosidase [Phycisphaerales bacterium]
MNPTLQLRAVYGESRAVYGENRDTCAKCREVQASVTIALILVLAFTGWTAAQDASTATVADPSAKPVEMSPAPTAGEVTPKDSPSAEATSQGFPAAEATSQVSPAEATSQESPAAAANLSDAAPMFDLSKEKVLYCVGYAHLDTQWRWDFCTTIDRYIRNTLDDNFALFEKYPQYRFNFTGSVRYRMMKEYYPERYERLKKYIAAGKWYVSGSSVDEGDANVPSAEAIIRQVLYGNQFFRREFGKESVDFMLPDCFGFPASMPSIWAHCGLRGFSTQKLTWGSAVGIPFKIGVWEGLDGQSVIAALDPGSYARALEGRVDLNETWIERIETHGRKYGVFADYHYYGVGDQGGAPREEDVANYVASIDQPDGRIKVALVSSDQMYKDITPEQRARLPRYRGDLLLTEHSAGTLTSQAYMKRWNRKGQILADAAERAAVAADWLGAATYPFEKINRSWERVLANQMHDILPGTSIPRAYTYSWNDEILAMNGFAAVIRDSVGGIVRAMDTRVKGAPLVVYNSLSIDRQDIVEATLDFGRRPPAHVAVFDCYGRRMPSQLLERSDTSLRIAFLADVLPVSLTVFDVRDLDAAGDPSSTLKVSEKALENEYYRVTINDDGDVSSIFDKKAERELLAAPAGLVFTYEKPRAWPAWNMDWNDRRNPPIDRVKGPAKVRVVERGPARVVLEIQRTARNSIITQQIRLSAGSAGRRIEFKCDVDWQSTECALKASFPLAVSNPNATYNWGMGTIQRGDNEPTRYEVPSHEWFDLTDASGKYGVSVLEDCKFGSDKPADNELRLTLLYTPGVRRSYLDQHSQDWGRHDITYAVYGHTGDWRDGRSEWQARRLNQPLQVFTAEQHAGDLGPTFSWLRVSTEQVDVRALKRAEDGDRVMVRVQELWGREAKDVELALAAPIADAYEVDGQERRIGDAKTVQGKLAFDVQPYRPRSFCVKLAQAPVKLDPPQCRTVAVEYNADVVTSDTDQTGGRMDADGRTYPAEVLPATLVSDGIEFDLATTGDDRNAIRCEGQRIPLPDGDCERLYLLAAAEDDVTARFTIGAAATDLSIQSWTGFIGQWDNRTWDTTFGEVDHICEGSVTGITPGYVKRDDVAWFATHRHAPDGNEAYRFSYLYKYGLDVPPGADTLTLPDDPRVVVFAVTLARGVNDGVRPATPLYDDFTGRRPVTFRHVYPPPVFQGVTPIADAAIDRQETFEALSLGAPVTTDYADASSDNHVVFYAFDPDGRFPPHRGAGAVDGTLPRLNDGDVAANDDDTKRCVWYDNEGRFFVDLGRNLPLARVNTYSWHRSDRAPQYFSLWGSNAETMPTADITHDRHEGWTLIAVVRTKALGEGGIHGSSIADADGPLGPFRHLLWVAQDVGQGTFFTEIDVHVVQVDSAKPR